MNNQQTISKKGDPSFELGNKNGLSELDVKGLNLLYSCPGTDNGNDNDGDTDDGSVPGGDTNEDCKDDNASCATWAGRGECDRNPGYMLVSCKLSCKKCSGRSLSHISFLIIINTMPLSNLINFLIIVPFFQRTFQ